MKPDPLIPVSTTTPRGYRHKAKPMAPTQGVPVTRGESWGQGTELPRLPSTTASLDWLCRPDTRASYSLPSGQPASSPPALLRGADTLVGSLLPGLSGGSCSPRPPLLPGSLPQLPGLDVIFSGLDTHSILHLAYSLEAELFVFQHRFPSLKHMLLEPRKNVCAFLHLLRLEPCLAERRCPASV